MIKASSTNLHQLMLLASSLPSSTGQSSTGQSSAEQKASLSTPPNVQGAATLNAVVQGTLQNPRITAQLAANNLQVNQSQWSSLQLGLTASPSEISIQNGSLVSARRGQLDFSARAGLRHWSYMPSDPIAASLQVRQMPIPELEQAANLQYPVEGDLVADLQLRGSELDPQGQGKIHVVKAKISGEPLQNLLVQFQASGGSIHSTLTVALSAGRRIP